MSKSGASFPATRACLYVPEHPRLPENICYCPCGPTYPCETLNSLYFLSARIFWTEIIHWEQVAVWIRTGWKHPFFCSSKPPVSLDNQVLPGLELLNECSLIPVQCSWWSCSCYWSLLLQTSIVVPPCHPSSPDVCLVCPVLPGYLCALFLCLMYFLQLCWGNKNCVWYSRYWSQWS